MQCALCGEEAHVSARHDLGDPGKIDHNVRLPFCGVKCVRDYCQQVRAVQVKLVGPPAAIKRYRRTTEDPDDDDDGGSDDVTMTDPARQPRQRDPYAECERDFVPTPPSQLADFSNLVGLEEERELLTRYVVNPKRWPSIHLRSGISARNVLL
jgi:hypothetical protein